MYLQMILFSGIRQKTRQLLNDFTCMWNTPSRKCKELKKQQPLTDCGHNVVMLTLVVTRGKVEGVGGLSRGIFQGGYP